MTFVCCEIKRRIKVNDAQEGGLNCQSLNGPPQAQSNHNDSRSAPHRAAPLPHSYLIYLQRLSAHRHKLRRKLEIKSLAV